ncbi:MAG: phytoene/squalene synthase family protein [Ignavibacteria bacterium]|nr:phytoene/squalene synthase family protein [Ignavibacteria bacterium]
MIQLYHNTSYAISKKLTNVYSTSFSLGIKAFAKEYRDPIYAIYGFVRLADEIVDTFHEYNKAELIKQFRIDTFKAINDGISTNPVLHSFQLVVNQYKIDHSLIDAFLYSMEMDLDKSSYQREVYDTYIYGSAEVVGLMCLKVFVNGDEEKYRELLYPAKMLGSAFQKVNFLRDIKSDIDERGRIYLPDVHKSEGIDDSNKKRLEAEVKEEFHQALKGILKLPIGVKLGVYSAYLYYYVLFKKIERLGVDELLKKRVRISNVTKLFLLVKSYWAIKVVKIRFD